MSEETAGRNDVGKVAPRAPHLPPRDGVDRGVAGSLVQLRDRERAGRLADRAPAARDWHLYVAAAMVAATAYVLVAGLRWLGPGGAPFLFLVSVPLLCGAGLVVMKRYEDGDVEKDVEGAIRRERYAARELEKLRGLGWAVLHDRLVPGTEHRLAHLLVGPAGVIIASLPPNRDALRLADATLYAGATALDEWCNTRWWEAETLHAALVQGLADWPWKGPVFPLVLVDEERLAAPRWMQAMWTRRTEAAAPSHPLAYNRIAIRDVAQARQWVTALPSPLGPITSAQLAGAIEGMCPPAATRQ